MGRLSIKNRDLYKLLGVLPSANAEEIKRAYRSRAKRLHPDNNRGDSRLEEKFKIVTEAYETLSDEGRRKMYDASRVNGAMSLADAPRADGAEPASSRSPLAAQFSKFAGDFLRGAPPPREEPPPSKPSPATAEPADDAPRQVRRRRKGSGKGDLETEMTISLEEAYRGVSRSVTLSIQEKDSLRRPRNTRQDYDVKIPPGIRDGQRLRLKREKKLRGRADSDIYFVIRIEPHPVFEVDGDNLKADLLVAPWEAALGQELAAPSLDGLVKIRLPRGISSGQRIRVKGRGFPRRGAKGKGALYLRVMIAVPGELTPEERRLFEKLAEISRFEPRKG